MKNDNSMKNKKGFTLVELIVVIAIIGILAAVLIPSITGYIRKARFSSDQQDASNMTMIVSTYCAENNIKMNLLTPNEVKTIILTDGQYNLVPRNSLWTFVWNVSESKVEAMYFDESIEAAETIRYPEEVLKSGYYLIGKGETAIEIAVNAIRNFSGTTAEFNEIITDLRADDDFSDYADLFNTLFNPSTTLFINENGSFTTAEIEGGGVNKGYRVVTKVLFGDSIAYIPAFGDKVVLPAEISVPATIEYISEGAFSGVGSSTKLVFSGNPIFEEGFKYNSTMLDANGGVQPRTTSIDHASKGIALMKIKIGDKDYESGSFLTMSADSILLAIQDFKETNGIGKLSNAEFRFGYSDDVKFDDNGLAYVCKFVVKLYSNGKLVGYSCLYYREIGVIEK